jgi:hypothetical protein
VKRTILIELMMAVAATAALSEYAIADTRQQGGGELGIARNAWAECVRAAIPRLDHPPLTSDVVARAAMDSCADQYSDLVRALSRTLAPTCARDSDCTRAAVAKAQGEATRTAVDEVMTARIRVAGAQVLECQ